MVSQHMNATHTRRLYNYISYLNSTTKLANFALYQTRGNVLPQSILGLGVWCLTPLSTIFELYRKIEKGGIACDRRLCLSVPDEGYSRNPRWIRYLCCY